MAHPPTIILFGYDSSPFTQKIRLSLALRRIPYTYVLVTSMMPRPILVQLFDLTYRKIPVLAIDRDVYIDTSLILEALACHPSLPTPSPEHPPLHPDEHTRTLTRILSSHYTDRPLFRFTTGLIPQSVWSSSFGVDRAELIGHKLDAAKLGAKVPLNLSGLDTFLSIMEPLFSSASSPSPQPSTTTPKDQQQQQQHPPTPKWFLSTPNPTAADISLYYQLHWGMKMSRGEGINDLTGGNVPNTTTTTTDTDMTQIFNKTRYPGLSRWFDDVTAYFDALPSLETRIERSDYEGDVRGSKLDALINRINSSSTHASSSAPLSSSSSSDALLLPTSTPPHLPLDTRLGLSPGVRVSIFPRDTGRANPTYGMIRAIGTEEVVIVPDDGEMSGEGERRRTRVEGVRLHFPRVEFGIVPTTKRGRGARL